MKEYYQSWGVPGWLSVKESACDAEDTGDAESSIPGWGRSPGGGHGNLLQYSCLENPMDRGARGRGGVGGWLPSIGSQKVRHSFTFLFMDKS